MTVVFYDVLEALSGAGRTGGAEFVPMFGGLTPSIGALIAVLATVELPIMAMVRPRQAGFCYTEAEYAAAWPTPNSCWPTAPTAWCSASWTGRATWTRSARGRWPASPGTGPRCSTGPSTSAPTGKLLGQLIDIGIDRVLTSGLAPDVFYGIDTICEMMEFAQGAIQIMPGAGVNLKNVDRIVEATGCDQIHVARFRDVMDTSTANNRDIFFGGALYPPEDRYSVIDGDYIARVRARL